MLNASVSRPAQSKERKRPREENMTKIMSAHRLSYVNSVLNAALLLWLGWSNELVYELNL